MFCLYIRFLLVENAHWLKLLSIGNDWFCPIVFCAGVQHVRAVKLTWSPCLFGALTVVQLGVQLKQDLILAFCVTYSIV